MVLIITKIGTSSALRRLFRGQFRNFLKKVVYYQYMSQIKRILDIDIEPGQSAFLWGIRQAGKSSYLHSKFPNAVYYDLLKQDLYTRLLKEPHLLREDILALSSEKLKEPVIIDEVQKIPSLLDEVHWLIENTDAYFILCGSSARKLKRGAANLLGGRAWSFYMYPLTVQECAEDFDLLRAMNAGLIPSHYLSGKNYRRHLKSYVEEYLREEIQAESLVRNLANFARFLDVFAYSQGELLNYSNVARDCGVDSKTVKEYYQILVDTLMGYFLQPFSQRDSRDTIRATPKFYLADLGLANHLRQKEIKVLKGEDAGHSLEHLIFTELIAYKNLMEKNFQINFWRNKNNLEVDFILNRGELAVEVKISSSVRKQDLRGLIEFKKRFPETRAIVISQDPTKRLMQITEGFSIEIYPWKLFLEELWSASIVV